MIKHPKAWLGPLYDSALWARLEPALREKTLPCTLQGVAEGQKPHLAAAIAATGRQVLLIASSEEASQRLYEDAKRLAGEIVLRYPARSVTLYTAKAASQELYRRRIQVLGELLAGRAGLIVASVDALIPRLPPVEAFRQAILTIQAGRVYDLSKLAAFLSSAGYTRQLPVETPGEFNIHGYILDIFPIGEEQPVRVEFFDEEVDTLRRFDPVTQRSTENLEAIRILPAIEMPLSPKMLQSGILALQQQRREAVTQLRKRHTGQTAYRRTARPEEDIAEKLTHLVDSNIERLLTQGFYRGMENEIACFYPQSADLADYMKNPLILLDEPLHCRERCDNIALEFYRSLESAEESGTVLPIHRTLVPEGNTWIQTYRSRDVVSLHTLTTQDLLLPALVIPVDSKGMQTFRGNFDALRKELETWKALQYRILLAAGSEKRAQQLAKSLEEFRIYLHVLREDRELEPGEALITPQSLATGFVCDVSRLAVLGEREIYGIIRNIPSKRRKNPLAQDLFSDIRPGDYIVHEFHGIGLYNGVVKLTSEGISRDYIKITYKDEDILYVPTEQIDRVQKYIGQEGRGPVINRLGGQEWRRTRGKVKKAIRDMADELLKLYAARQIAPGFAFSKDTPWQRQFEDRFLFEETPDQLQCIEEIKDDMESDRVMDRLLCGDVGYGKTEVALRAIFKAVMDKKQVAFLAPTTILAQQHYQTMLDRFEGFPIRVGLLSRFRSPGEIKYTLAELAAGAMDVVTGTHRLLSEDVKFRDLGLLVIDEEQRFGVAHKEKIKKLRHNVDVLTLSATPIPRTLNMSMIGLRDISVIDTPPEERFPVQTLVTEYDENMVRDAILREISRGGQVYFVYNKVESIDIMREKLQDLVPEAKIEVGHGQMAENRLEKAMLRVLSGEADIFLCTTIIENGLDIPRVNTIIIYDADHFGLSQLYQIRGRVGRSNRIAYAYFTYQPRKVLNEAAEKRLTAIREFTELGSGFKVAMRDLEIRGTGNLLGSQQSGFMVSVGYGLYCKMIEEAVAILKGAPEAAVPEPVIELRTDANIPDTYVPGETARLDLYRRISDIRTEEDCSELVDEMMDRFGDPPPSVLRLTKVALLRGLCMRCGIEKLTEFSNALHLRLIPKAPLDPGKLLALVMSEESHLSIVSSSAPLLKFRISENDTRSRLDIALSICSQIILCTTEEHLL
ncbi:MAG: transcription-repair coupling factor [Christensenellales bacterium]|jgi:transcription-repair coupling factor (superfamily II helicase)